MTLKIFLLLVLFPVPKPNVEKPTKDKNPAPSKQNKSALKLDPKAWNVPTQSHEDIKPDVSAVAMISDSSLACQLYSKCRHSNATIALVAPRDLAINGCRPTMAIIPFIQSQEGLPDRSIDLQVWVHCISAKPLQPVTKREVVHISLQDKNTSVMRCHIPSALIQGFDSLSFSKASKSLQLSTISSLLDEDQKHIIDVWKISWDSAQNSYTCFVRVPSSRVKGLLSKSKPASVILDVPLDFKEKVSIVWLKKAGIPLEAPEVQVLMHEFGHLGCFCKQGVWAIRAEPDIANNIRSKLGQDGTPSFSISGIPVEFIDSEVKEFCAKLGWRVTVDSSSRRCRSGKASWIVRSEDVPPTSSTYLFSDFQRYRISIVSTRRAPRAPTVAKLPTIFSSSRLNLKPEPCDRQGYRKMTLIPLPLFLLPRAKVKEKLNSNLPFVSQGICRTDLVLPNLCPKDPSWISLIVLLPLSKAYRKSRR